MKKVKRNKDVKKLTLQIKESLKNHTRNNDTDNWTIDELSTISPLHAKKNIINEGEISMRFTDDNINKESEGKVSEEQEGAVLAFHTKTKSQSIKTIKDLQRRAWKKPPIVQIKPNFEDDVEPITFNEYVSNAKMAKEQKHKIDSLHSRSNSKTRLLNFFRPSSTKETPNNKNRQIQAEFNIQTLLKGKKKKNKLDKIEENDHVGLIKRKNLNYKTPPPELAQKMHFKRQS